MPELKRGRLSKDEEKFIRENFPRLSIPEIATKLNRSTEPVEKFIRLKVKPADAPGAKVFNGEDATTVEIRQELRNSQKWAQLKKELTPDEIKFFEEEYIGMMGQFKADVLHTEEAQIFDAIKLELLKNRNMIARRKAGEEVARLERMLEDFHERNPDIDSMSDDDKNFVLSLETQVNVARSKEQEKTNEWTTLQGKVENIRKALKSNRDQRVKEIESSKVNYMGIVKTLQQRDVQELESRQNELLKMAANKAYEDLGQPHKFDNGEEDLPILSADTIELLDANSSEEEEAESDE